MPQFGTSFPDGGEKKTTSIPTDVLDEVMHLTGVWGYFAFIFHQFGDVIGALLLPRRLRYGDSGALDG